DGERVVRWERPGRLFLGDSNVSGRFEETVKASGGCRGFRKKEIQSIETPHVANPIRFEDGLASCNGQRVKCADRPLRVLLQIVEVRRIVPFGNAIEDA